MDPVILTIATDPDNRYVKEWKQSLGDYSNYKILGENVKWDGFTTKMKLLIDQLNKYQNGQVVIVTDCYDLVFVDNPKNILNKYLNMSDGSKILIGSEDQCMINCSGEHIYACNLKGKQLNVNGGFVMGPAELLKEAYEYCLKYGNEDDQIGFSRFFSKNCDKFVLDTNNQIVLNYYKKSILTPHLGHEKLPELEWKNGNFVITRGSTPSVIHMPYQTADMGKRSEFVRSKLFPDRKPISNTEYFGEWVKHVGKTMKYPAYQEFIGLVFLIIVFVVVILVILWTLFKRYKS